MVTLALMLAPPVAPDEYAEWLVPFPVIEATYCFVDALGLLS